MNCQEVQIELSDYLEKSLDAIRMKSVETHLLSCPLCRAEADGITDCIGQIAQLPILEPPAGFAQRIMALVLEFEVKPSFWQRLFAPLRVTMPIQAAAVVLIAILAVFLYPKESQIKNNKPSQLSALSLSKTLPLQSNKDSVVEQAQSTLPSSPTAKDAMRVKNSDAQDARQSAAEARRKTVPNIAAVKDPALAPASSQTENTVEELKDAPHRAPIQAQEVAAGRENLQPSGDPSGFGGTLGGSLRSGLFAPERALSPVTEPSADVEFIVRRRETQTREQKEDPSSDALRRRAEADAATPAATAKRTNPAAPAEGGRISEIRWFTVPAERYDQFRKELAAEAAIESEKAAGTLTNQFVSKSNRELLIKVIVLSPTER